MASIAPITATLDKRLARHLLRRATFVLDKDTVNSFTGMTVDAAVDALFQPQTLAASEPKDATDGYWLSDPNFAALSDNDLLGKTNTVLAWFYYNAVQDTTVNSKLTMFLHNQFTCSIAGQRADRAYDYIQLLQYYATSGESLRDMALKMTFDNLMLLYLDNTRNFNFNPNENFAREFFELFTIGKGEQVGPGDYTTYTEEDVVQAARVFTGVVYKDDGLEIDSDTGIRTGYLEPLVHDTDDKTFSARFGNQTITGRSDEAGMLQELTELIDMIYDQNATATFLATRLYRYFVSDNITTEIENDIIAPLSSTLVSSNYDLSAAAKQLLKSEHFYDADDSDNTDNIIGGIIKSPLQLSTEIITQFDIDLGDPDVDPAEVYGNKIINTLAGLLFYTTDIPFMPESVAGYPAYYQAPAYQNNWFNSNTVITRYRFLEYMAQPNRSFMPIYTDMLWFLENSGVFSDHTNPTLIVEELTDYVFPEGACQERKDYLKNDILLQGYPESAWLTQWTTHLGGDSTVVQYLLEELLKKTLTCPEYQGF